MGSNIAGIISAFTAFVLKGRQDNFDTVTANAETLETLSPANATKLLTALHGVYPTRPTTFA